MRAADSCFGVLRSRKPAPLQETTWATFSNKTHLLLVLRRHADPDHSTCSASQAVIDAWQEAFSATAARPDVGSPQRGRFFLTPSGHSYAEARKSRRRQGGAAGSSHLETVLCQSDRKAQQHLQVTTRRWALVFDTNCWSENEHRQSGQEKFL